MTLEHFLRLHAGRVVQVTTRISVDSGDRARVSFLADPGVGGEVLIGEVRDNGLQGIDLIDRPAATTPLPPDDE